MAVVVGIGIGLVVLNPSKQPEVSRHTEQRHLVTRKTYDDMTEDIDFAPGECICLVYELPANSALLKSIIVRVMHVGNCIAGRLKNRYGVLMVVSQHALKKDGHTVVETIYKSPVYDYLYSMFNAVYAMQTEDCSFE